MQGFTAAHLPFLVVCVVYRLQSNAGACGDLGEEKIGRVSPAWLSRLVFQSFAKRSWLAVSGVSRCCRGDCSRGLARWPLETLFQPKILSPALVTLGDLNPELALLLDPTVYSQSDGGVRV